MSKIRIYELAKEAGIGSKELADKLIKKGYPIKGHSSTVDEDTAAEIRRIFFAKGGAAKDGDAGQEEAPVKRRVIIRRKKSEAVVDETPAEPEREEAAAKEAPSVSPEEKTASVSAVKEVEEDSSASKESVAEPASQDAEPATVIPETVKPVEKKESFTSGEEKTQAIKEEKVETPVRKKTRKKEKQPKKSTAARVVGRVELPVSQEDESSHRSRKKSRPKPPARGARSSDNARPVQPGFDTSAPVKDDSRGKKGRKGRRNDDADMLDTRDGRSRGKKGKKNVKYTHFGNDYQPRGSRRGKKKREKSSTPPPTEMKASKKRIKVYDTIAVGELASRMKVKAGDVIGKLMGLGVMATINQAVDTETAMIIAEEYGYEVEQGITEELGIQMLSESEATGEEKPRSPVVTVMGHVDHGKTSILDAIRKTDVADGEAGGITQHIGAYHVKAASGDVTFVDTPGHAAFTEMRSRGAQITDLVILVVAADDGVMDQTREAISHAQAADVPIIVAVNKIDKDNADPDRVKRELAELDLAPEEWGGQTMYFETSAKKQQGIDELMEGIQLMAEMLELKADPDRKAMGRVIEAQLDKGRGAVATILVQAGTLHQGDHFVVGQYSGKVRAMLDYKGRVITKAGPSIPVEVQGLSGVPSAGDEFIVVTDEKMAKSVSQARAQKAREAELGANAKISLDKLFEQMNEGDVLELRVVLRADVQGTLEAFAKAAEDLSTKEIKVRILQEGTGTITETDIMLASASDAIIIGFNVRPTAKVKELATREAVDVRSYDVIYHALDDIKKAMVGMLDPTFEEEVIGEAEVRNTFNVPKVGVIAGCAVQNGKILRNAGVRVLREGVVVYTAKISSLRRYKDDVKEVASGYECGIGVENFNDVKVGDILEAFVMTEVEATLE